jgi:hypothetical protein
MAARHLGSLDDPILPIDAVTETLPKRPRRWVCAAIARIAMHFNRCRGPAPNVAYRRRRVQIQPHKMTALAWALLVTACAAPPPPPPPELPAIEERLRRLDERVTTLERLLTNLPSPPLRSRAEIVKNIQSLEKQRAVLLERYTPAHPDVREIDLRLRLLRLQLDMLDQVGRMPQ